ncbi:SLC35C2 [Acanthosepion pharaonis]|uniref:SLC35C2 n=1 Tax=Acanthosepion pharaonis TaxID=158019 RepID=A0A812AM31_ACAPH|nr:SLC35C2 [Sepia pharaonis]
MDIFGRWLTNDDKEEKKRSCVVTTSQANLTFYNKKYIKQFHLPLSITMIHLVTKFLLAWLVRSIWQCKTGQPRIELTWIPYLKRVAPPGVISALDIGLSNWSFEFITVSLYTMCKSTAVIFILGFSLLFKLEKFRPSLVLVVFFISGGLFLFTYHSTQFHIIGFILVMSATFLSGLRWTLTQIMANRSEMGLRNPIDMMYHLQPWMILGLLPLSATFEGIHLGSTKQVFRYDNSLVLLSNIGLLSFGAFLAFFMETAEFLLLANTSSLTLSIAGIFKEVLVLFLAAEINGDHISFINGLGFGICLIGMMLHIILKTIHNKEHKFEREAEPISDELLEMLTHDGNANDTDDEEESIFRQSSYS